MDAVYHGCTRNTNAIILANIEHLRKSLPKVLRPQPSLRHTAIQTEDLSCPLARQNIVNYTLTAFPKIKWRQKGLKRGALNKKFGVFVGAEFCISVGSEYKFNISNVLNTPVSCTWTCRLQVCATPESTQIRGRNGGSVAWLKQQRMLHLNSAKITLQIQRKLQELTNQTKLSK